MKPQAMHGERCTCIRCNAEIVRLREYVGEGLRQRFGISEELTIDVVWRLPRNMLRELSDGRRRLDDEKLAIEHAEWMRMKDAREDNA